MSVGRTERIAHYRVLKRIGRGGMGIVYRAVDERDGRVVALKVIRDSGPAESVGSSGTATDSEARLRFGREAEILKGLLHVNVVSFYEIGEDDGVPYLAMEYLDGVPITTFAGRPYSELLPLMVQAAHGMEYLATRGIIHRDLSPDNVFVVEVGGERIVKLLDFGLAKLFDRPPGHESLTASGLFFGKVAYGSPEQLGSLAERHLDWRSDVYSLGVIFFELLSGHRPFEGKTTVDYIVAHVSDRPPPLRAQNGLPALPKALVRLVEQMLAKRREERPQSYLEIIETLVTILRVGGLEPHAGGESSSGAEAPGISTSTSLTGIQTTGERTEGHADAAATVRREPALPARESRGWRLRTAALAGAGLALAAGAVLLARRWPGPSGLGANPSTSSTPSHTPTRGSQVVGTGRLQIVATPFARVISITDTLTGRQVSLEPGATTPLVVETLAPAAYRIVLSCPAFGEAGERETTILREMAVAPGESALLAEPCLPPERLLQTLWK